MTTREREKLLYILTAIYIGTFALLGLIEFLVSVYK